MQKINILFPLDPVIDIFLMNMFTVAESEVF
jgi:hypothetical protein